MDPLIVKKVDGRGVNQIRGRELMQYSKGKDHQELIPSAPQLQMRDGEMGREAETGP